MEITPDHDSATLNTRIQVNRANAQLSTGPKTEEGKAASAQNRRTYGFNSPTFILLPWESADEFNQLLCDLKGEFHPMTPHDHLMVVKMAQHYWLAQRALILQKGCFDYDSPFKGAAYFEQKLALYLRYQTTHERAFHRCRNELLKIDRERERYSRDSAAKRRQDAIDSRIAEEAARRDELQRARLRLTVAKAEAQELKTQALRPATTATAASATAAAPFGFVPQNDLPLTVDFAVSHDASAPIPLEQAA